MYKTTVAHLIGKGDVRIYGREDIKKLCKNAGLYMESFEKRGFCRLHCVIRKLEKQEVLCCVKVQKITLKILCLNQWT